MPNTNDAVVYFWYDHLELRNNGDAAKVEQAIATHDLAAFSAIKAKYEPNERGWVYFPEKAFVYRDGKLAGELDITTQEGFAQITEHEYECG